MGCTTDVRVSWKEGRLECSPPLYKTWWKSNASTAAQPDVRWSFDASIPATAKGALINWEDRRADGYLPFPPGGAIGCEAAVGDERLPRLVIRGNYQLAGKFKYTVSLVDGAGTVIASLDPEGQNDPNPPGGGG